MKKVLSLFLLLFGLFCQSQELLPFVENYDKSSYKGDNQVWSVVQGQDKAMYFANNHYLLRYNGVVWEKYFLPNKTIIRSIFSDGDRIYSGSYKEFGYWKRSGGKMFYFSISKGKNIFFENENEEIWKIFKVNDAIYFQSFNQLYVYEKGSVKKITFPYMISYCFLIDGDIFVATVEKGIFKLVQNQLKAIPGWDVLKNSVVHGIQKRGEELFIFTQKRGVFIAKNEKLIPWSHPLNELLKNTTINLAQFVSKDRLIIGTGLRGLFIYDFAKKTFQNINRKNVLLNNSVLSIGIDSENDLWLGLDNGISHVEINSPVSILYDNSGALGSVYSVVKATASSYLIASNHGVFEFEQNKLSLLPNTQGQSWNISPIRQGFMIGHNDGTFLYQSSTGLSKLNGVNGGWNLVKSAVDASLLQATYTGILVYPNPNNLKESRVVQKLLKPIKYLAQNRKNEIWAADNYRGFNF